MNKILVLILFVLPLSVKCQFQEGLSFKGKSELIYFNQLSPTTIYGGELNVFLSENFSLDYSLAWGENYFHLPASVPITRALLEMQNEQEEDELDTIKTSSKWSAFLALLLPEGFTGHINIGNRTYFSPSIKPLCFDFIGKNKMEEGEVPSWYFSNDCGLELEHFVTKNWFVSVFGKLRNTFWKAGSRDQKNDFRYGYSFGVKVGGYLGYYKD